MVGFARMDRLVKRIQQAYVPSSTGGIHCWLRLGLLMRSSYTASKVRENPNDDIVYIYIYILLYSIILLLHVIIVCLFVYRAIAGSRFRSMSVKNDGQQLTTANTTMGKSMIHNRVLCTQVRFTHQLVYFPLPGRNSLRHRTLTPGSLLLIFCTCSAVNQKDNIMVVTFYV